MPNKPVSRRSVLAGAGAAVASGVALTAKAPAAQAENADDSRAIGVAPSGATAVEFRGRIAQTGSNGETFSSDGFLTRVKAAQLSALFAGSPTDVSTALLTVHATGQLTARVLDESVHALDIVGDLAVYQRRTPGADFADPASFTDGSLAARFTLTLQDVLTVFAPAKGLPTLTGDMVQTEARTLTGALAGRRLGYRGQRLRLYATGLGTLVDPVTLNALLEIAGNWSTP
jgi:hypothetical protein